MLTDDEFVQGKTLSELTAGSPEKAAEMGSVFAEIGWTLHHARVARTDLPRATEPIRRELGKVDYIPDKAVRNIAHLLDELDREQQYVHGDFHPNNVIMTADGPVLIDMGGFSLGSPLFDLATLRFSLFESPEAQKEGRSSFNGLTREEARHFWEGFEKKYFGRPMNAREEQELNRVTLLKKLRFEHLYGNRYPERYCDDVRREIVSVFSEERE